MDYICYICQSKRWILYFTNLQHCRFSFSLTSKARLDIFMNLVIFDCIALSMYPLNAVTLQTESLPPLLLAHPSNLITVVLHQGAGTMRGQCWHLLSAAAQLQHLHCVWGDIGRSNIHQSCLTQYLSYSYPKPCLYPKHFAVKGDTAGILIT